MNVQQAELYQRIQSFSLDNPDASLSFSKRLARDNAWTAQYSQRVIEEYKKFVFLAVVAGHPVTPSDQVDQVWHLHLLYTHSYWGEFCPNVLQTPLHHGPTRGGKREHHTFNNWYSKTLASYELFFGQTPPADIWPPAHIRFGRDVHFVRVNTQQTWLIPKRRPVLLPKLRLEQPAIVTLLFVLALTVTGCQASILTIRNPLDFKGPEFLAFYLLVASAAILLACFLRWCLRQPLGNSSGESVSLDAYETAYLAGGKYQAIHVAIASLVQRGHLKARPLTRTLTLKTPLTHNSHPLEQAIEQAITVDGSIHRVRASVANATDPIYKRLQSLGLLLTERQAKLAQQLPASLIFAVLLLGITKIVVGISRGKPVGFLVVLCIITAIIGFCFLGVSVFRTRSGDRVLSKLRTRHANLRQTRAINNSQADSQLELAFALFSSEVLTDSSLTDLKQVLTPPVSSTSTSGSGDSSSWWSGGGGDGGSCGDGGGGGCGGGGCGGGGCGGCGGG